MSDHSKPEMAGSFEPPVEFFSQCERKEATENMTANGFIALMENRPCIQNGLHVSECVLNHPELLVFQRHILWQTSGYWS